MNKKILWILIICIFLVILTIFFRIFWSTTPSVAVKATVGENVSLVLAANPTTGYRWRLAQKFDENMVKFVNFDYKVESKLIGAGGKEIWTFRPLKAGTTKIFFEYLRPWEKNAAPLETRVFEIMIR